MPILPAFLAAISLVGTAIGLYNWHNSYRGTAKRKYSRLATLIGVIVSLTFLFVSIPSAFGGNGLQVTPTPTTTNQQVGTGSTPTQVQPTHPLQPTSIPTPSPTPEPRVYKADWSNGMDGWTESGGWSSVNGMLVNDGSQYSLSGDPTVIAPYPPQDIANYSVQADIRLDRYTDEGGFSGEASFGIVVRSPDGGGGYKIGVCVSAGIYSCGTSDHEIIFSDGSFYQDTPVKQSPFRPAYGTWHTYRIDLQGNTITVWVDGGMVFQLTDDKFLSAGRVGLWSDRSQVSVRSFTITAL